MSGNQGNVREIDALTKVSENCQGNLVPFAKSGKSSPFH